MMEFLRTLGWVLYFFGAGVVLAAKEFYSVFRDMFIGILGLFKGSRRKNGQPLKSKKPDETVGAA